MEYIKWVIIYLIFSLIFAQCFKETNRSMKNASALTILLEAFTALFAIILSPPFCIQVFTKSRNTSNSWSSNYYLCCNR